MALKTSPYTARPCKFEFTDGGPLWVPEIYVKKYPKLFEPIMGGQHDECWRIKLGTSGCVGHILVHYLYTGTYQCLESNTSFSEMRNITEFTTSVITYSVANDLEIIGLKELAKNEMERLGPTVRTTVLLDTLGMYYPSPRADDEWLHNYIKSRVDPLLDNPQDLVMAGDPSYLSIHNFLLRAVVDLYTQKVDSRAYTPSSDTKSMGN